MLVLFGSTLAGMSQSVATTQNSDFLIADFQGSTLRWIHIAEPEFDSRRIDVAKYHVCVVEFRETVAVSLDA